MIDSQYLSTSSAMRIAALAEEATKNSREASALRDAIKETSSPASSPCGSCHIVEIAVTDLMMDGWTRADENLFTRTGLSGRIQPLLTAVTLLSLPTRWEERLIGLFADGLYLHQRKRVREWAGEEQNVVITGDDRWLLTEQAADTRQSHQGNNLYALSIEVGTFRYEKTIDEEHLILNVPKKVTLMLCLCGQEKAEVTTQNHQSVIRLLG
ncbi:MAG: hypothetical protein IJR13_07800 [Bacteroidales bacterium]|nr:hypothetical protein [Bacteroidales bacterium]